MARLGLRGWSRLSCTVLASLAACGGESVRTEEIGGAGDTGSDSGRGGSSGNGGSKSANGGTSAGKSATTAGTDPGSGGTDPGTGGTGAGGVITGGNGGSAGDLPEIPVGQACETFEPCGGDPTGSWTTTETCLEVGEVTFLEAPGCEDAVQGVGALVVGTRVYENGGVTHEQAVTVRVDLLVNDACAAGLLQADDVGAATLCPFLPTLAGAQAEFRSFTCETVDAGCRCDVYSDESTTTTTTTYAVDGTRVNEGTGASYDFCQQGDSLILHGTGENANAAAVDDLTVAFARD